MSQIGTQDTPAKDTKQRLTAPFDSLDADIIVRSSDKVDFPVRKCFLAAASAVFEAMLSLPQPENTSAPNGLPVVELVEDSRTLDIILRLSYPIDTVLPADFIDHARSVLETTHKYAFDGVLERIKRRLHTSRILEREPLRMYTIACSLGMEDIARSAARQTLRCDPFDFPHVPELRHITAAPYSRLLQYHRACSQVACSAASVQRIAEWVRASDFRPCFFAGNGFGIVDGNGFFGDRGSHTCAMQQWREATWPHHIFVASQYILDFLQQVDSILQKTPCIELAFKLPLFDWAVQEATKCVTCAQHIYGDINKFYNLLKSDVENKISAVILVFEQ